MAVHRTLCWALVLIMAAGCTAQALTSAECAVEPKARINCGYPGISAAECNNRGCCFDSKISGVIWCFQPSEEVCTL